MASIYKRKSSYAVIYYQIDGSGKRKQKWESFKTEELAQRRKYAIEHPLPFCEQPAPIRTVNDLMQQFFELYGTIRWTYSTVANYESLRRRFVEPLIGKCEVGKLTGQMIVSLYLRLMKGHKSSPPICTSTLRDLNKLLKCAFRQTVVWGVIEHNPFENIAVPKEKRHRQPAWNEREVWQAVAACGADTQLALAIQLAFACSLRMGELLALKWSDVNPENGSIHISKTMQRISRETISLIGTKDIIEILPCENENSPTLLAIKTPKTESSIRTVFLPNQLDAQLQAYKSRTDWKADSLVFHLQNGKPLQPECLRKRFCALIDKAGLHKVTFHSLRHSSVTYKLRLTHGNIKAVQGDTGHAQANMVLEVYAEILDDERRKTAMLMNADWYGVDC